MARGLFASSMLVAPFAALTEIRHPRPDHGPLVFRVMAAVIVQAGNEAERIVSGVVFYAWINSGNLARLVSVATVEDLPLV